MSMYRMTFSLTQVPFRRPHRDVASALELHYSMSDLFKEPICIWEMGRRHCQSSWLTAFPIANPSPSSEKDAEFVIDDEWPPCQHRCQEPSLHFAPVSEAPTAESGWITVGFDPSDPTYPPPPTRQTPTSSRLVGVFMESEAPHGPGPVHDTSERCDSIIPPINLQGYLILQLA